MESAWADNLVALDTHPRNQHTNRLVYFSIMYVGDNSVLNSPQILESKKLTSGAIQQGTVGIGGGVNSESESLALCNTKSIRNGVWGLSPKKL